MLLSVLAFQEPSASIVTPTTTAQAWDAVRTTGYKVQDVRSEGFFGHIVRDGVHADGTLTMVGADPARGTKETYPYLSLSLELTVPKEIDPVDTEKWLKENLPNSGARFTPHLGRTVTAWRFLNLTDGATTVSLKEHLDEFWADAKTFAKHYGGTLGASEVDGKTLRFAPTLRLRRADETSLQRVFGSWGYTSGKKPNVVFGGWTFPIEVQGKLIWVRAYQVGTTASPTRFTLERVAAEGTAPLGNPIDLSHFDLKAKGVFFDGTFHPRESVTVVDLGDGLSLADLRRRVEEFVSEA